MTTITRKQSGGFTLIELMIAVAIIGILAALAFPGYIHNVCKAQVSEAITVSGGLQNEIASYYALNGSWPENNNDVSIAMPLGKYATAQNIQNGWIIIRFTANANSQLSKSIIGLEPVDDGSGNVHWKCGNYALTQTANLPSSCQDTLDF